MRYRILFLVFFVLQLPVMAQVTVDTAVKSKWLFFREKTKRNPSRYHTANGESLVVQWHMDTLNKNDYQPDTSVQIVSDGEGAANAMGGNPQVHMYINESVPLPALCHCSFNKGLLTIEAGGIMGSFQLTINKGKIGGIYFPLPGQDLSLFPEMPSQNTAPLKIPVTAKLVVDRPLIKDIKELHGYMQVTTLPYYNFSEGFGFVNNYIRQSDRVVVYFHCRPAPGSSR